MSELLDSYRIAFDRVQTLEGRVAVLEAENGALREALRRQCDCNSGEPVEPHDPECAALISGKPAGLPAPTHTDLMISPEAIDEMWVPEALSKEWCLAAAEKEMGDEIGAGLLAFALSPEQLIAEKESTTTKPRLQQLFEKVGPFPSSMLAASSWGPPPCADCGHPRESHDHGSCVVWVYKGRCCCPAHRDPRAPAPSETPAAYRLIAVDSDEAKRFGFDESDWGRSILVGPNGTHWVDGGEPEDRTFHRDWSWVPKELNALAARLASAEKRGEEAEALSKELEISWAKKYDIAVQHEADVEASWAQRLDDAVQPLQERCTAFVARADAAEAKLAGLDAWLTDFEAETKALPLGEINEQRGASSFNWRMWFLRQIRAVLAPPALVKK